VRLQDLARRQAQAPSLDEQASMSRQGAAAMDRMRDDGEHGKEQRADIDRLCEPRMPVTPWIARDPIPYAIKEAIRRRAEAERTAFIHDVVALPFRSLCRLALPSKAAAVERRSLLLGPDHDRTLREAMLDRERARGQLLAAIFALPVLILGRWRSTPRRGGSDASAEGISDRDG
jgi:hypothetical protein